MLLEPEPVKLFRSPFKHSSHSTLFVPFTLDHTQGDAVMHDGEAQTHSALDTLGAVSGRTVC